MWKRQVTQCQFQIAYIHAYMHACMYEAQLVLYLSICFPISAQLVAKSCALSFHFGVLRFRFWGLGFIKGLGLIKALLCCSLILIYLLLNLCLALLTFQRFSNFFQTCLYCYWMVPLISLLMGSCNTETNRTPIMAGL